MKKYAVIVAGGSGVRMGSSIPKQFLLLHGKSVLQHSIDAFLSSYSDLQVILVLPKDFIHMVPPAERVTIVSGGSTRFFSVREGLAAIDDEQCIVFVHDGVRCLLTTNLIESCYNTALKKGNAIPAIKAVDSLRIVTDEGNAAIDRNKVWIIQTPQTFIGSQIKKAFLLDDDESFTDEASVVEKAGFHIHLVEGEANNIKITRPIDILVAEKIILDRNNHYP